MFEVGFTEIILIVGLALLVLGPEKLPGLVRKVGRWTGRARAMARQLQTQLEQEVTLDEIMKSQPKRPHHEQPSPAAPADESAEHPGETQQSGDHAAEVHPAEVHPEEAVHPAEVHPEEVHPAEVHAAEIHPEIPDSTHPELHDHATERPVQAAAASEADGADHASIKSGQ